MIELGFTVPDLAQTRFAVSPLWEVVAAVRVLKSAAEHPLHRPWIEQVRPRLAGLDLRPLTELVPVPTRVIPAFVCPPPTTPMPDLEVELSVLRATPAEVVRDELDRLPGARAAPLSGLYANPADGLDRLADAVRAFWEGALAAYWPRILTLLEDDIRYRAHRLAEGGAGRVFADLDPAVGWDEDTLRVAHRHIRGTRSLGGRGLLLVPSAFIWPRLFSVTSPPWQPTLRYPPRGIATLWQTDVPNVPEALAKVLGHTRALLLCRLHTPATTQDLARRTGLTAGGVSQHLTALRAAGFLAAHRSGRYVLYRRTAVTEALLAGCSGKGQPFEPGTAQDQVGHPAITAGAGVSTVIGHGLGGPG
ncbi:ArsR/SmtB family transcription factor [Actinoallomurus iriomotensis]|uniref:Transcriptional regulator n=1 Tax=Actinoallomurus iriomotensis TaxID=478107 RepID=A0A9W6RZB5_9ACTN|nr:DUF5937 family protein [Actinoallomurus iriomotensis]GLY84451.1 transcriptional regulator [Actinoallomurus iriomotensis]